jgi:DNA-binding CsgD family transcriptional regulator
MELATRVGLTRNFGAFLAGNLAEPLVRLGEWKEAEQLASETLAAGLIGVFAASLHELLGYLAVHTGRPEKALGHVREAHRQLGDSREQQFLQALVYIEAEARRADGDLDRAADLVAAGLEGGNAWSARYSWPLTWLGARVAADTATRARDRQEPTLPPASRPAVDDLDGQAPTSFPAAVAYRATALAEQAREAGGPTVPAWEAAVSAWREGADVLPLTYCLFRLAEALCTAGDREPATQPLREAVRSARQLGAAPLLEEAVALSRRARISLEAGTPEPAPAAPVAAPYGLTDREREVLALVAAGRSNGQIATALFISPKTASVHVSNILAKFGVSSRIEAAGMAHRLGLVESPPP